MSLKYRDKNGAEHVLAGLTPGGDMEYGAVATRSGTFSVPATSADGSSVVSVTFGEALPDAEYEVIISSPAAVQPSLKSFEFTVFNKTVSGFQINAHRSANSATTAAVTFNYKAFILYDVADADSLYSEVEDIKTMIPASASSTNKFATASDLRTETRSLDRRLDDVEDVIPDDASISNKLATAADVEEAMENAGLKTVETIPASPEDGAVVLFVGTTTEDYQKGGIYQYSSSTATWTLISTADIDVDNALDASSENPVQNKVIKSALDEKQSNVFVGTTAAWNALSATDKAKYNLVSLTDDTHAVERMTSYVGMIIESTVLDTMAKVIEIYGGTTWIQHSGYVLRGATSGVAANSAVKTSGNDTHTHTLNSGYAKVLATGSHHYEEYRGQNWTATLHQSFASDQSVGSWTINYATNLGGTTDAGSTLPSYKSVYIWERTE